ncbi:MAG: UDP-N-acetylmuramoyl-L-alanyl-D-glutamate--2,6-diaminopimelate ligase [Limnochordales bacterium]|nr:UDP-N-acetylmuramoyl-L-alanyl-D-glutamate--2,6-diaminopimelate ligase [Limnochordales bacterium]
MRLARLLAALPTYRLLGGTSAAGADTDILVSGIAYDSRMVRPGKIFVAVRGMREDGHHYAGDAVLRGAVAVVGEEPVEVPAHVVQVIVPDSREALSRLSAEFYGHPSRRLRVIGVTGTKGKTSTTYLIKAILEAAGGRVGLIGTIQNLIGDQILPAHRTTPESTDLQALLWQMAEAGVDSVVMEVSSHALALKRVQDVAFDVAVFTNIGRDHLDFHPTPEEYLAAKKILFRSLQPISQDALQREGAETAPLKSRRFAAINRDDRAWQEVAEACAVPVLTYSLHSSEADIKASILKMGLDGTRVRLDLPSGSLELALQLIGKFNVYNAAAAAAVGVGLGVAPAAIKSGLEAVAGVPGRFQRIRQGQPFEVVVDYAHTPDSLEQVLQAGRELGPRRLLVVFGCGGDRDKGKRPLMGAVAARCADQVFITSDNPRSEDPESICRQIEEGFLREPNRVATRHEVIVDRRAAIRAALAAARAGDLVVIAGKGHETYQEFARGRIHFDDAEVARQVLAELARGGA